MKNSIIIHLWLVLFVSGCSSNKDEWKLVWSEEFNDAEIDWNVWSKVPRQPHDWDNTMADADELIKLEDGKLFYSG